MTIKNIHQEFESECREEVAIQGQDEKLKGLARDFFNESAKHRYSYHFSWMGRPIIQYPQDIVAMQELIWQVKPDLIIETGVAHGGSLILSASMLALLEYSDAVDNRGVLDPTKPVRKVLGLDIDIREHNRHAIRSHPLAHRIEMIQGSSIDCGVVSRVKDFAKSYERILVVLDSNHTHDHVLAELEAYAPLISIGSYCVVFDTVIEDLPEESFPDRPWGRGNNAKTAVWEYLRRLQKGNIQAADGRRLELMADEYVEQKLLVTVAPSGYLRRVG